MGVLGKQVRQIDTCHPEHRNPVHSSRNPSEHSKTPNPIPPRAVRVEIYSQSEIAEKIIKRSASSALVSNAHAHVVMERLWNSGGQADSQDRLGNG